MGGLRNGEINLSSYAAENLHFFRAMIQMFVRQMLLNLPRNEVNTGFLRITTGGLQDRDISGEDGS